MKWAATVVEAGVPARDDQADAGVDRLFGIGELAGVEMALQVIDRDQGQIERQGQGLRGGQADHERTDQARPGRDGDHSQVFERDPCAPQGLVDHRQHLLHVGPRSDLGNHTPKAPVQARLRGNHAGEHPRHPGRRRPRPLEHRSPRLVAGCLDGQENQAGWVHGHVLNRTRAEALSYQIERGSRRAP